MIEDRTILSILVVCLSSILYPLSYVHGADTLLLPLPVLASLPGLHRGLPIILDIYIEVLTTGVVYYFNDDKEIFTDPDDLLPSGL